MATLRKIRDEIEASKMIKKVKNNTPDVATEAVTDEQLTQQITFCIETGQMTLAKLLLMNLNYAHELDTDGPALDQAVKLYAELKKEGIQGVQPIPPAWVAQYDRMKALGEVARSELFYKDEFHKSLKNLCQEMVMDQRIEKISLERRKR